jgi:hypothetical protein
MSATDLTSAILSAATVPAPVSTDAPVDSDPVTPVDSSSDAVADSSTDDGGTGDGGADEDGQGGEGGDAKPAIPTTAQIRASLKAFRDTSPEHAQAAKLLNDGYSRFEAYKQVFPTVDDARSFKAQLDTLGGLEGIANMQTTLASVEETDALLEAGDPKVLDQIFEDSPEGAKKLAAPFLAKLAKVDPEAFARTVQPHLVRSLIDSNFPQVLAYLATKLGDNAEAKSVVANMQAWFDGQKSQADRSSEDVLSPERDQIAKDRAEIAAERRRDFDSQVASQINPHIHTELGSRLKPYSASLVALPEAVRQDVARACITELAAALKADKAYQTQITAMNGARKPDRDKIIAYNKTKVSSLADGIISKVVARYNLKPGTVMAAKGGKQAAGKPGAQRTPQATSIANLQSAPKDSDIDWNHENMSTEAYIRGRAVLTESAARAKGLKSRFVSWKK